MKVHLRVAFYVVLSLSAATLAGLSLHGLMHGVDWMEVIRGVLLMTGFGVQFWIALACLAEARKIDDQRREKQLTRTSTTLESQSF